MWLFAKLCAGSIGALRSCCFQRTIALCRTLFDLAFVFTQFTIDHLPLHITACTYHVETCIIIVSGTILWRTLKRIFCAKNVMAIHLVGTYLINKNDSVLGKSKFFCNPIASRCRGTERIATIHLLTTAHKFNVFVLWIVGSCAFARTPIQFSI